MVIKGIAELLQARGAESRFHGSELLTIDPVRDSRRPDPDGVAGQLTRKVDGCGLFIGIAREVEVLPHIVLDAAVDDPWQVGDIVAVELRAAGQIDQAAFSQIDAGALLGIDDGVVHRGVAVAGEFRAVGKVQRHISFEPDRTALIGVAAADYGAVFDVQSAACRLHVHRAAVARGCAVADGGFGPPALLQGEGLVPAIDRAAGTVRAACCGAVFKACAGDVRGGFTYTALAVQCAAVIGSGTVPESAIDYFDRLSLGVYGPAEVIAGICAGGAAPCKGGVFNGCSISVSRRFIIVTHEPMINCTAIRGGPAILKRAVFHIQGSGSGFDRAAVGPGVPVCIADPVTEIAPPLYALQLIKTVPNSPDAPALL